MLYIFLYKIGNENKLYKSGITPGKYQDKQCCTRYTDSESVLRIGVAHKVLRYRYSMCMFQGNIFIVFSYCI